MSQFHWEPDRSIQNLTNGMSSDRHEAPPRSRPTDAALDAALRSVPLPAELLTRLDQLVYAMPDETADQVDWLGC